MEKEVAGFFLVLVVVSVALFYILLRLIGGSERREGCISLLLYFVAAGVLAGPVYGLTKPVVGGLGAWAINLLVDIALVRVVLSVRLWKAALINLLHVGVLWLLAFGWLMFGPITTIRALVDLGQKNPEVNAGIKETLFIRIPAEERLGWKP